MPETEGVAAGGTVRVPRREGGDKVAKVILICGKICSGKSTYAMQLRGKHKAVLLSTDEIMLAVFGQYVGDKHDEYVEKIQNYLFEKSVEIIRTGINVILDWGFWQKDEREFAKKFYHSQNIECEFHYIDISDKTWQARLSKRNSDILSGRLNHYFVDENLAEKFERMFEISDREEMDVWLNC